MNSSELEIMNILWKYGSLKPVEIQNLLSFPIKNSALRWQLSALVEKGHVSRRKTGKAFLYKAITERENVFQKFAKNLANVFCDGSAVAMIGALIESDNSLTAEDIKELQKLAARKAERKQGEG
jgi:BlaI family transcriptional regulator, penicillinase repressor